MLQGMADSEERIARSRDRERQYEMLNRSGKIADYLPLTGARVMSAVLELHERLHAETLHCLASGSGQRPKPAFDANRAWEVDRALMLEKLRAPGLVGRRSPAWCWPAGRRWRCSPRARCARWSACRSWSTSVTGETTIQQRLALETIPPHGSAGQAQPGHLRPRPRGLQLVVAAARLRPGGAHGGAGRLRRLQPAVRRRRPQCRRSSPPARNGASMSSACACRRPAAAATGAMPPSPTTRSCARPSATCRT